MEPEVSYAYSSNTASGESSSKYGGTYKTQALLIAAESKILSLECEVGSLRQQLREEKLRKGSSCPVKTEDNHQILVERCHKLEQERCDLSEEVAGMKLKWKEAVAECRQLEGRQQVVQQTQNCQIQALQEHVQELQEENEALEEVNDHLRTQLHQQQLLEPVQQCQQLEEMSRTYTRSLAGLQQKLSAMDQLQTQLLESQAEVERLQRQLRLRRQDDQFVQQMKSDMESVERLEQQVKKLQQDNQSLLQDRTNTDLLRHQLHDLQRKCSTSQGIAEEAAQLRQENERLKAGGGAAVGVASETHQLQLAELQQREIISKRECGTLSTQLAQSQRELAQIQEELSDVQGQLERQKTATNTLEDRVQKLERRLIFVSKERDGCVNVLNSYKMDSGVDGVLKEWLTELKHQLEEKDKRILQLEADVPVLV